MRRTLDPSFMNAVLAELEGEQLSLDELISDPRNITLTTEFGGWCFVKQEPGVYEVHTQFLKAGRGRHMFAAAKQALRYVFTCTDALEIVTKSPLGHIDHASRLVGFQEHFRKDDVSFQMMTFDRWLYQDETLEGEGRWFHDQLPEGPSHPEDPTHDRVVGASVLMIKAGNLSKGVWSYNRWARLSGYQTIEILSLVPPIIDVLEAIVEVREGRMEILKCHSRP